MPKKKKKQNSWLELKISPSTRNTKKENISNRNTSYHRNKVLTLLIRQKSFV